MGRRWLLAALALPIACGSRTPLLLPADGDGLAGAGSGGGGLGLQCTAGLQEGSPTPMLGYCPTRANHAPVGGPRAPQIAWSVTPFPIDDPEDYLPGQLVVDATGRAYLAVNASPSNSMGGPNRVAAVDSDGTVAWIRSFPGLVSDLTLGGDGTLWLLEQTGQAGLLVGLAPDGTTRASLDLALGASADAGIDDGYGTYGSFAIGSDGSFFLGSSEQAARIKVDGRLIWRTVPSQYVQGLLPVILTPADHMLVSSYEGLVELDTNGLSIWNAPPGYLAQAVDAEGRLLMLAASGGALSLTTLDGSGKPIGTLPLASPQDGIDASQLALAGNGLAIVLLADEVASPGSTATRVKVVAVDPAAGKTQWTTVLNATLLYDPASLETHYGLFVDGAGSVIVTAGAVTGLDLASGVVRWTVQPPGAHGCLRPAVLGTGGAIVASQCDGSVLLARDP